MASTSIDTRSSGLIREDVCQALRHDILHCTLRPGVELREQELAARFGVSKSPVRDALLRLEREGLVVVVPRQGYRVAPVSVSDARDMFGLRSVLESANVMTASRSAGDASLAGLDAFRSLAAGENFIDYNRRFHSALARCTGNARMAEVTCNLIEHMDRLIYISVGAVKGHDPQQLVDEHAAIIAAVQARNGRLARRLAQSHIERAEKRVIDALEWTVVGP